MSDMNRTIDSEDLPPKDERDDQPKPAASARPAPSHKAIRPRGFWLLGLGALLPLAVAHRSITRRIVRS